MYVYYVWASRLQRSEEAIRAPGTGVTEASMWVLGIEPEPSTRAPVLSLPSCVSILISKRFKADAT